MCVCVCVCEREGELRGVGESYENVMEEWVRDGGELEERGGEWEWVWVCYGWW